MTARGRKLAALFLCGGMCVVFAALAWSAVRGKSATWDEPSHAASGWFMLWRHDYRLSPDVPPLWEYWTSLASGPGALHLGQWAGAYRLLHSKDDLFAFAARLLYQTPGNDGIALVAHGRAMSLVLGVVLAIVLGRWAWVLGGPVAAACAMLLFCFDPDFLGHAPLVKNDVAFTLLYFASAYALWRLGRRLTVVSALALAILASAALMTKLTGVLLCPVVVIALVARALNSESWRIFGREVSARSSKLLAAGGVCVLCAAVSYVSLWACYGFRFNAGPDGLQSDTDYFVQMLHRGELTLRLNRVPTGAEMAWLPWHMPWPVRAAVLLYHHHLIPQAFASGLVITEWGDQNRFAFLCGHHYNGGHWIYFPLAALFKLPLATLAAGIGAIVIGRGSLRRGLISGTPARWTAVVIAAACAVYGVVVLTANMNIGLRHAFPLFPFAYLLISLAAASVWETRSGRRVVCLLGAALILESCAAFPDFIAFFNAPSAPWRLSLLADSNLDWGQDLPLLAAWQNDHPNDTLYLSYFGSCDPAAYGIRYVNLYPGYDYGPPPRTPDTAGFIAISATNLQQVNGEDPIARFLAPRKPAAVLGHTIYIYRIERD